MKDGKKKEEKEVQDRIALLSMGEIEKFFRTPVWKCIEDDIRERYLGTIIMIENAPKEDIFGEVDGRTTLSLSGMGRLQGELSQMRMFLALKDLYKQDRESLEEEKSDGS